MGLGRTVENLRFLDIERSIKMKRIIAVLLAVSLLAGMLVVSAACDYHAGGAGAGYGKLCHTIRDLL